MESGRVHRLIDLFAGAGGLTLGFTKTGRFRSVFAVEFAEPAARTYAENFHHGVDSIITLPPGAVQIDIRDDDVVYCGDITKLNSLGFGADVVIGGPPCQGFSPLGKMYGREEHKNMNELWQHYMRIVHQVRPLGFLIENVPELLKSREFVAIRLLAEKLGYRVRHAKLRAVEFGVPQRRVRGFIMGLLGDILPSFPKDTGERQTVWQAIGDLPAEPTTREIGVLDRPRGRRRQDLHIGRSPKEMSLERYRLIQPGENRFALAERAPHLTPKCWLNKPKGSTDVFGRLREDQPAYTIRTEFFKPEKGCYLHPREHRPITHREAARLQTFDDWFYFHGSKIEVARQIGNAVPPRLAEVIAERLAELLPVVEGQLERGWQIPRVDFETALRQVLDEAYGPEALPDPDAESAAG